MQQAEGWFCQASFRCATAIGLPSGRCRPATSAKISRQAEKTSQLLHIGSGLHTAEPNAGARTWRSKAPFTNAVASTAWHSVSLTIYGRLGKRAAAMLMVSCWSNMGAPGAAATAGRPCRRGGPAKRGRQASGTPATACAATAWSPTPAPAQGGSTGALSIGCSQFQVRRPNLTP